MTLLVSLHVKMSIALQE